LAIAKFLRFPAIEVYVLSRHADWITVRERAARGQGFPHPDLEEFGGGIEPPSPAPSSPAGTKNVHRLLTRVLSPRVT
jgi:hypothetical protein